MIYLSSNSVVDLHHGISKIVMEIAWYFLYRVLSADYWYPNVFAHTVASYNTLLREV